jgi:hypothetical protein
MRVETVTFGQIAALLIVLSLGLPTPSQATTFWEDGFENHLTPNWDTSACTGGATGPQDGCNPSISTDIAHSGTHSLKGTYTCTYLPRGGCGTFYDRTHAPSSEMWTRVYYYTVGFTYDSVETKHYFHKTIDVAADFIPFDHWFGSRQSAISSESQLPDGPPCLPNDVSCNYTHNLANIPLNNNQWYCIETHVKENTAGQANGMVEQWVDGVQTVGYYGRTFHANPIPQYSILRIYVQAGHGLMYYDDLAVGNTRIGCTADTIAPDAPLGLKVQ